MAMRDLSDPGSGARRSRRNHWLTADRSVQGQGINSVAE